MVFDSSVNKEETVKIYIFSRHQPEPVLFFLTETG